MSVSSRLQALITKLTSAQDDAAKLDGGNKTAGKRVRAVLLEVKNEAHELRKAISAVSAKPDKQ